MAVLAVDPSSPFSGGAILGDRVRMLDHTLDDGVFIRSMATRGRLGGLALATPAAVRLLDAAGFDVVLLETVGVGQVELEVAGARRHHRRGRQPRLGRRGAGGEGGAAGDRRRVRGQQGRPPRRAGDAPRPAPMLRTRPSDEGEWTPPIVETVATEGTGIAEMVEAVWRHRGWPSGKRLAGDRAQRLWQEVETLVALRAADLAKARLGEQELGELRRRLGARELDPWEAAEQLLS